MSGAIEFSKMGWIDQGRIDEREKIEKLIAVLAVGTAWAIKVGEWRAEHTPIRFNKHRGHYRPQYSYFRYGLEFIRDALLAETGKIKQFKLCIQQIINPPILC